MRGIERRKRGAVLVIVVAAMVVLLMCGGLAVDVALWYKDRIQASRAAELAALAGYSEFVRRGLRYTGSDKTAIDDLIREYLRLNGITSTEAAAAAISLTKSGYIKVQLQRDSKAFFSRFAHINYVAVAGTGLIERNRVAPFVIPQHYNDEDRDQRPNYDPKDPGEYIQAPVGPYLLGNPYILLYSVESNDTTTRDLVYIPMDDDVEKIPVGSNTSPGTLASYDIYWEMTGGSSGKSHIPDAASPYVLWQDVPDLTTMTNPDLYKISVFRAYGIMWDVLGAPKVDGEYPYVRWLLGMNGGGFLVEKRFLEAAGYSVVKITCPAGGCNADDYVKIVRTSYPSASDYEGGTPPNRFTLSRKGQARQLGDTGVRAIWLKCSSPCNTVAERDWYVRSKAFVRWLKKLYRENKIRILDFGRQTTSDDTRVQPLIATYTGTTDPVTRVLSYAGIPFEAFFAEWDPRIDIDTRSTCVDSFAIPEKSGSALNDAASFAHWLRDIQGYHWLHVHHEDFAEDIWLTDPTGARIRAIAGGIRAFVKDGGFLFDACLGTETLEAALAYIDKYPAGGYPIDGPYTGLSGTLAFDHFTVSRDTGLCRLYVDAGATKMADDITGYQPPAGSPDLRIGKFKLTDYLNPRSQDHNGFAGSLMPDLDDSSGTAPMALVPDDDDHKLNAYIGTVSTFAESLIRNPKYPAGGEPNDPAHTFILGYRERSDGDRGNSVVYLSGAASGTSTGEFAMIGGHLPHHDPYTYLTKENFIEGVWYHAFAAHLPWKVKKIWSKKKFLDAGGTDPADGNCDIDILTQWRAALGWKRLRTRFIYWYPGSPGGTAGKWKDGTYIPDPVKGSSPRWWGKWYWRGDLNDRRWIDKPGWQITWVKSGDGFYGWWLDKPVYKTVSDPEAGTQTIRWWKGNWWRPVWWKPQWKAWWWEYTVPPSPAGYISWEPSCCGYKRLSYLYLKKNFSWSEMENYYEVMGNIAWLRTNTWWRVGPTTVTISGCHTRRNAATIPCTLKYGWSASYTDTLAWGIKGHVSDPVKTLLLTGNKAQVQSIMDQLRDQWGKGWPTIMPNVENDSDTETVVGGAYEWNTYVDSDGLTCTYEAIRKYVRDCNDGKGDNFAADSWFLTSPCSGSRLYFKQQSIDAVTGKVIYGFDDPTVDFQRYDAARKGLHERRAVSCGWQRYCALVPFVKNIYGKNNEFFFDQPRYQIYTVLMNWITSGGPGPSFPLRKCIEVHGHDMVIRDLDNDGYTDDVYESVIFRGVPDLAFNRLYLNNILLGAMAAEREIDTGGSLNCGAVKWDDSVPDDSYVNPFPNGGTNTFVDIMRLGLKGGFSVGDVFYTAPADLADAVAAGTNYIFTDFEGNRDDDPTDGTATTVTWEDYVTMKAPDEYYKYVFDNGAAKHLYNDPSVVDPTTRVIKSDFIKRPLQIMSVAVVERTTSDAAQLDDYRKKSIYFSTSRHMVKVIGVARFFIIDREIDRLTYDAAPGDTSTYVQPPYAEAPTSSRETIFLGKEPDLTGEVRGHFLGWEVRPPNPDGFTIP